MREPGWQLAVLHTDGWGGRQQQPCVVVGETPKRFRVRAVAHGELRLPRGRHGLVKIFGAGTHLVPKTAITFTDPPGAAALRDPGAP